VSGLDASDREALAAVLGRRAEMALALFVPAEPKTTLALEYDERPPSVEEASRRVRALAGVVAPVLGPCVGDFGSADGGAVDVAAIAVGGEVVHERP
jgi:hypothetical protein